MYKAVGRIMLNYTSKVCLHILSTDAIFSSNTQTKLYLIKDVKFVRIKNKGTAMHSKAGICSNYFKFIPIIFFFQECLNRLPPFSNTIPTIRVLFDRNVTTNIIWKSTPKVICGFHFWFETACQSNDQKEK